MSKIRKKTVLALGLVVFALLGMSAYGVKATSTTEFCLSCHEMAPYQREMKFSSHAKDKDGKDISCAQCHLPPGIGPRFLAVKIYSGFKDLFVHLRDKPDDLPRVRLQPVARRFIDDASCLACHADLYKDAKGEKAVSEIGKVAHDAYLGKNGQASKNCVGCHINLAHLPEFDRSLEVNAPFKSKLLKEEGANGL